MKIINVLKIEENKRDEINSLGIVICTYEKIDNSLIDGISTEYKSQFPTFEEVGVIDKTRPIWHNEEKSYQIIQNKSGVIWGILNLPEVSTDLIVYRNQENISTYNENDKLYFYINNILPEHQAIFDAYPQLEITVNKNN